MWLLDTVALSELKKKQANPGFIEWLTDVRGDDIHTFDDAAEHRVRAVRPHLGIKVRRRQMRHEELRSARIAARVRHACR